MGDGNGFFNILYTAIVAIAGALAKEINDRAKNNESFKVFVSEVIFHGFSGWISALLAIKYSNSMDILSITIFSGLGGLFGYDLIKVIFKMVVEKIGNIKPSDKDF